MVGGIGFFLLGFLVFEKLTVTRIFCKKKIISFCVTSFSIFLKFISFFYQGDQLYQVLGFFTCFLLVFEPF